MWAALKAWWNRFELAEAARVAAEARAAEADFVTSDTKQEMAKLRGATQSAVDAAFREVAEVRAEMARQASEHNRLQEESRAKQLDPLLMRLVDSLEAARTAAEQRADALQVTLDRVAENRYDAPPRRRRQKRTDAPANPLVADVMSLADDAAFIDVLYGKENPMEKSN